MNELEPKLEPVVPEWELYLWNQSQAESSVCVLKYYKDLDYSVLTSPRGEVSSTRVGRANLVIQVSQAMLEPIGISSE